MQVVVLGEVFHAICNESAVQENPVAQLVSSSLTHTNSKVTNFSDDHSCFYVNSTWMLTMCLCVFCILTRGLVATKLPVARADMKGTKAKESKNGYASSKNENTSISGGKQETKKKGKKSLEADLEVAVKKSNVQCSAEKEKDKKNKNKTNSKHLIDAADGSVVKEKETLPKKKPDEQEDCIANQEVTERKLKKKTLKKQLENVKEVEEEKQTGDRKQNKKSKKRKYETSFVTEGSGENFTEVMQKKEGDEEAHEALDEICIAKEKKKKKAKMIVAEQVETETLEDDPCESDKVTQVKKVKKSKKEKTQCEEKEEMEDRVIKKKKKSKSKKSETVEEEMVSERKVKKKKSKTASVEVTEVEEEVAVKKKKKKDQQLNRAEKEHLTVDCEGEQNEETDMLRKKKKKNPTKNSEEAAAEQNECHSGAKRKEKEDKQQVSVSSVWECVCDWWSKIIPGGQCFAVGKVWGH